MMIVYGKDAYAMVENGVFESVYLAHNGEGQHAFYFYSAEYDFTD